MLTLLPSGQGVMAVVWLAVVVVLILAASRAARLLPILRQAAQPAGEVVLRGSLALDGRRRVHLVDVGGRQALILTGGATDVLLGLPPAAC